MTSPVAGTYQVKRRRRRWVAPLPPRARAGLFADMATTGERLVKWNREFTPEPRSTGRCTMGMMQKWQAVYADQLEAGGRADDLDGRRRGWCKHPPRGPSLRERRLIPSPCGREG